MEYGRRPVQRADYRCGGAHGGDEPRAAAAVCGLLPAGEAGHERLFNVRHKGAGERPEGDEEGDEVGRLIWRVARHAEDAVVAHLPRPAHLRGHAGREPFEGVDERLLEEIDLEGDAAEAGDDGRREEVADGAKAGGGVGRAGGSGAPAASGVPGVPGVPRAALSARCLLRARQLPYMKSAKSGAGMAV